MLKDISTHNNLVKTPRYEVHIISIRKIAVNFMPLFSGIIKPKSV